MDWKTFDEEKPARDGRYLVSYAGNRWGVADWKNGQWFDTVNPDGCGAYSLRDPIWWADPPVPTPEQRDAVRP